VRWPWSKKEKTEGHVVRQHRGSNQNGSQLPSSIGSDLASQQAAANAALGRADADFERAVNREPEVEKVSSSLRRMNKRNRFSEMMLETFRGTT
jgi:hypothetical protein